ncbi:MAG: His Kinase A (Phospho-acceptor) domain-containing protein [uncultured Thiotrichaceae bacterium]|uniref:histidine kinase n=1 Tax=uncultured Thiotrichaceae bacterium TaxID=298394 RepID=A0A6S6TMF7_9GAMM|nr:MAG: His Kinase A (Phospho-acceptor) domain-containing protein [uncultured Thiotrichaceae bacterium]
MKKITSLLVIVLVLTALAGILSFLYMRSQNINSDAYNRVNDNLRSLKQLDAEWNVDVLRSKVGSNQHYDPLTNPQKLIRELKDGIGTLASQLEDNTNILPTVNKFQEAIQNKLNLIEDFKSQHAIFKNSLSFLPTAAEQLQADISSELEAQSAEIARIERREMPEAPPSDPLLDGLEATNWRLYTLRTQGSELLTELLKYNLAPDEALKSRIEKQLARLDETKGNHAENLQAHISVLLAHSRTVLKQRVIESEILSGLDAIPTVALNDELNQLVGENFEQKLAEQNKYRRYLTAYAGLLLLLLAYAAYRLLRAFNDLKSANENLEQHVAERTSDLNQALKHLQESQTQLVQSEKMASLGQMVAGITHEINTPLAYVKSGLEITQMRLGELTELANACNTLNQTLADENASNEAISLQLQQVGELSHILEENETMSETEGLLKDGIHGMNEISEIITGLKNFSRMDRAKVAAFNVNEGLESTLKIANNIVKYKSVQKHYGDVQPITCSPSSINQVFLNLITNAAQATDESGEILLTTTQLEDAVKIEVRDNGTGISTENREKIFDPFFTTKDGKCSRHGS